MKTILKKKVLIALDYDPTALKVAEKGYNLAKTMDAEVILLHVIAEPIYYSSTEYSPIMGFNNIDLAAYQLDNIEGLFNAAQYFLDKTKHHLNDETIQTVVKDGDIADAIVKAANNMGVDMIIVGSHSHKWLENILLGSVSEQVLKNSTIPIYIVPTKKKD